MKKSLLMLSLLGLGFTQANASIEISMPAPNHIRMINTVSNNEGVIDDDIDINVEDNFLDDEFDSASDDEISAAIRSLSAKAQQKEDHLAALAEKLSQRTYARESTNTNIISNRKHSVLDGSAAPAIAAARASRAAHSQSIGRCARYVRKALQAAGYQFTPNPSAYQYATRGTLQQAGFVKVSNNTPPQVGDVVVFNRSAKHRHGHIQIYDGQNWVSDFRQNNINPYRNSSMSYTTWRDARYLDDASNKGIYLAMTE